MRQVEGVVLAAGLSRRAGRHKMTLPFGNSTVIETCVESMLSVAHHVIVVAGWQAHRIEDLLRHHPQVDIVLNAEYASGMFSSVRTGITRVVAPAFFLLPGDQPAISNTVYQQLLDVAADIVIPTYSGRKGHPVLFSSQLIPEILSQPADSTLRDFVRQHGFATVDVDDEGILLDIDTPSDYDSLSERFGSESHRR